MKKSEWENKALCYFKVQVEVQLSVNEMKDSLLE